MINVPYLSYLVSCVRAIFSEYALSQEIATTISDLYEQYNGVILNHLNETGIVSIDYVAYTD